MFNVLCKTQHPTLKSVFENNESVMGDNQVVFHLQQSTYIVCLQDSKYRRLFELAQT